MDASEVTLEQFFRSKWFGYLWKSGLGFGGTIFGVGSLIVTMVTVDTNTTARGAVTVASEAKITVEQMKLVQTERAALADQRAEDEEAWRKRLDEGLVRVNQRVTSVGSDIASVKGDLGVIKGILMRQESASRFVGPLVGDIPELPTTR